MMDKQKLTIKDIAQLSGVGKSTVSRVLNQDPKVSEKTREHVEKIIAQYDFQPSKSARAMRGIYHRTIGIIVSRLSSVSENQALANMLPLLYEYQCEPLIVESQFNPELVQTHLAFFARRGVDGVILFAFSELKETDLQTWKDKIVVIARNYPTLSSVYYHDKKAVQLLLQHLYDQGHRHIAYLGVKDQDFTTGYLRHQAYLEFCAEHQLIPHSIQGELGYEWAYQHISAVLSEQISALICATDSQAIGAVKYLQANPSIAIQVCGIGNNPLLHFLFPHILTVDLGFAQAGTKAVNQLMELLEKKSMQQHGVDCHLVFR